MQLRSLQEPPQYLQELFVSVMARARKFRSQLRQYNAAFAFTSLHYTADSHTNERQGITSFQIHGELYHLQGPLTVYSGQDPKYAQLYVYDPDYASVVRF